MAAKSRNPNYMQLYSYVPRELGIKFKTLCTSLELEQSAVVEQLISDWVAYMEKDKT